MTGKRPNRRREDSFVSFSKKVCPDPETGCWNWTSDHGNRGYGLFWAGSRSNGRTRTHWLAHRFAMMMFSKPVRKDQEVDHLCRNRGCVNPEHLEAVTKRENIRRSMCPSALNMAKTLCLRGHPFAPQSPYDIKKNYRRCVICKNMWQKEKKRKMREEKCSSGL